MAEHAHLKSHIYGVFKDTFSSDAGLFLFNLNYFDIRKYLYFDITIVIAHLYYLF